MCEPARYHVEDGRFSVSSIGHCFPTFSVSQTVGETIGWSSWFERGAMSNPKYISLNLEPQCPWSDTLTMRGPRNWDLMRGGQISSALPLNARAGAPTNSAAWRTELPPL